MSLVDAVAAQPALVLAVLVLASYRATRLIVMDDVLGSYPLTSPLTGKYFRWLSPDGEGIEDDDVEHWDAGELRPNRGTGLRKLVDVFLFDDDGDARTWLRRWLGKLITCSMCVGVWASAATLTGWVMGPEWVRWAILGAAVAGGQGFVSGRPGA